MRWPRYTTLQLLLIAALCGLVFGLAMTSWRANDYSQINALSYSPSGKRLAARYLSGIVRVWNVEAGTPSRVADILLHNPWERLGLEQLSFLDDDTLLDVEIRALSPSDKEDGAIRIIDFQSGRIDRPIRFDASYYLANYAAADDTVALVTLPEGTIDCYSLKLRQCARQLRIAAEPASPITLSVDGEKLVAIDQAGAINVIDLTTGSTLQRFSASGAGLVTLSPDGTRLAIASSPPPYAAATAVPPPVVPPSVTVHQIATASEPQRITPGFADPWIALSTTSNRLAVADLRDAVIYELDTDHTPSRIALDEAPRSPLSFLQRGAWRSGGRIHDYAFSPDGSTLCSFDGGDVLVWDVDSGRLKTRLVGQLRLPQLILYWGGFVGWAIAWGLVARRRRPVVIVDKPPTELRIVWGLLIVGGLIAVTVPVALLVMAGPELWPGVYYALAIGLVLLVSGTSRATAALSHVAAFQTASLIACDPVNFILGLIVNHLLRRPHVRSYLMEVQCPAPTTLSSNAQLRR